MYKKIIKLTLGTFFLFAASHTLSATLQGINFSELPGGKAEVILSFDALPESPQSYSIESPARIVMDFPSTTNALTKKKYSVAVGGIDSAIALEAGGRTRLILNLDTSKPYSSRADGNNLILEVGDSSGSNNVAAAPTPSQPIASAPKITAPSNPRVKAAINAIDFRRGEVGEGKVLIELTDPKVNIDVQEVSGGIEIKFIDTHLPEVLRRKLDVIDFATPVSLVGAVHQSDGTVINIKVNGDYDYLAYQADNQYILSVKPLTEAELEEKRSRFEFTGEKISLSFQDIQVRSVLQLIADFTDLNLVASDTVQGSITLRLDNVPWDQALDLVLKTKGLDKRQIGSVLMVAPTAEIAERERLQIETKKQLQELAPLRTEYIRVRYANARQLFNLFVSEEGSSGEGAGGGGESGGSERNSTGSILSERGQAIVDERTNSIILTDTDEKIAEFKTLIDKIDIPIRQVMIEARIVVANTDFRKELGSRIASVATDLSDSQNSSTQLTGRLESLSVGDGEDATLTQQDATLVDLGVFNPAGAFTFNLINSKVLLGLELSALESSGYAEIVSQPKVITGDKQEASIVSGTEIPFAEESASGGTTISFREAALRLDVTPQITPDNKIIMDLVIEQNSLAAIIGGVPSLDITELNTQVLVADGETIVLGGVYTTELITGQTKVPVLGDIPFVGRLFRNDTNSEEKREILIFVTPRIMASSLSN